MLLLLKINPNGFNQYYEKNFAPNKHHKLISNLALIGNWKYYNEAIIRCQFISDISIQSSDFS